MLEGGTDVLSTPETEPDVFVEDVGEHGGWISFARISPTTAAARPVDEHVAGMHRS